ncbi:MAG: dTMP kinase [Alphaproteobacteria bacterium]
MSRGMFITLEGGEGAGKSTQVRQLAAAIEATGRDVVRTREPGGTLGAEEIRSLVVTGGTDRWDSTTEALLMFASRRDHVERLIKPALARGAWVICDRFADSTTAYQGYGHGLGADWVRGLYQLVLGEFGPDLTLVMDIDPLKGIERTGNRDHAETRFERMGEGFHDRLRAGFLAIAEADPERCAVLDAGQRADAVFADACSVIEDRLGLALKATA